MKKLISVVALLLVLATMLTACSKFKCALCKEEKGGKQYDHELAGGVKVVLCEDCHEKVENGTQQLDDLVGKVEEGIDKVEDFLNQFK